MSDAVRREIEAFTRSLLESRLAQLTPAQRAMFDRIYPTGPKSDAMISAIDLCDRTITKRARLITEVAATSITASTIAALAAIDAALGMPEDACNSTARTLAAIRLLHSAHRDDVAEIERLERELVAARQTADYWKAEHLAGNEQIEAARAEAEALRHDMERQADALAELATENEALRTALAMMYDKWIDGDDCYEEPDAFGGFLGKAFQLSLTEEDHVISLIGKDRPARAIDAAIAKEKPCPRS